MIRYALENDDHDRGVEDELGTVGLQAYCGIISVK